MKMFESNAKYSQVTETVKDVVYIVGTDKCVRSVS